MISRYESERGLPFHTVMRLRPDVFWESRLRFPNTLDDNTVLVPYMEAGHGLNDHVAFGGRIGMRTFLTRVRQLHLNVTDTDMALLQMPPLRLHKRRFTMFSELFLICAF